MFSNATKKRFRAFKKIRRAWWSLWMLVAIFAVSLAAPLYCPDPTAWIDPGSIEKPWPVTVKIKPVFAETFLLSETPSQASGSMEEHKDLYKAVAALPNSSTTSPLELELNGRSYRIYPPRNGVRRVYSRPSKPKTQKTSVLHLKPAEDGSIQCKEEEFWQTLGEDVRKTVSELSLKALRNAGGSTIENHTSAFAKSISANGINYSIAASIDNVEWPHPPVKGHIFGIDNTGRDVFAQVMYGLRISISFGLVLVFWALAVGVAIGALQGYFGGRVDITCQRLVEIWSAIPFLYVMILVGDRVGRSFTALLVCYSLFNWVTVSRYVRAEFLRLRSRAFVDAARCQNYSHLRIIFSEILPNALTPLITLFPFLLMGAMALLASLDFLGFGLPPLSPSLGGLLSQAAVSRSAWWLTLFPAGALFIVMLLTVFTGEGLRDAFDPRQRSKIE